MTAAPLPIVMAITGASGAPYAVRLLEQLLVAGQPVQLIVSVARAAPAADGD